MELFKGNKHHSIGRREENALEEKWNLGRILEKKELEAQKSTYKIKKLHQRLRN